VVTDAEGTILWIDGDARVRIDTADMVNLAVGASLRESGAGTNAVGTALAAQHAVQVFASEHFNEVVHTWTCAAAPVRDPDSGELLGVVNLTGRSSTANPYRAGRQNRKAQSSPR
jgi:transcriptional regulator of acetoin/glycerol metabolism